jgi:hypothetical protein
MNEGDRYETSVAGYEHIYAEEMLQHGRRGCVS